MDKYLRRDIVRQMMGTLNINHNHAKKVVVKAWIKYHREQFLCYDGELLLWYKKRDGTWSLLPLSRSLLSDEEEEEYLALLYGGEVNY